MPLNSSRRWGVALICSVLNFLHLGTARLSGSMYLAVLERYKVDRSKAALPFILCYTVRNIAGPLVGYLATKIGIYTVTLLGGVLAFIGIGCCYFAEDIIVVILFWGVVFGFGFGMGSVLLPEILNQNFDKYLSNANGIAFGGECIAGFVLPIFLKFSLNTYGTSGTFLILSSLMLNSIPATLLLKYFSGRESSEDHHLVQNQERLAGGNGLHCSLNGTKNDSSKTEEGSFEAMKLLKNGLSTSKSPETNGEIALMESSSKNIGNEIRKDICGANSSKFNDQVANSEDSNERSSLNLRQRNIVMNWQENGMKATFYPQVDMKTRSLSNQNSRLPVVEDTMPHSNTEQKSKCKPIILLETNISNPSRTENQNLAIKYYGSLDQITQYKENENRLLDVPTTPFENLSNSLFHLDDTSYLVNGPAPSTLVDKQIAPTSPFKIFLDPAFCMILLTQSTMLFSVTMFWTIIVDFSRDAGLSSKEEVYILICLSVLDMTGRLGLGWITDGGYVSNSKFSGVCCFGMAISVGSLVFFRTVAAIGSSVAVFGLFFGGFLIVCPGVVNDHIPRDKRGMALASRFVLFAPMSLAQSPLIGYFRGKLGSYNFIFLILAVLCLFSSVTSLLTPYAEKWGERRKYKRGIIRINFDNMISTAGSASESFATKKQPLSLTGRINKGFLET